MDWIGVVSGVSGTVLGLGGLFVALRRASADKTLGVSTEERLRRRDTIEDRDNYINQLQEDVKDLRDRMSRIEEEYKREQRWNRQLVDHIYRQLPPPPPEREPIGSH